ncbi:MAG: hypothetical protein ACK5Q5_18940 [Planctomycetaceae bacterium]
MPAQPVPVNRTLVGLLAVACLLIGAAIGWFDSMQNVWCGSFVRTGLLLGAFWLALPSRGREAAWANVSPWTLALSLLAALLFVRRPRVFFVIIAIVVVAAVVIRPKRRR